MKVQYVSISPTEKAEELGCHSLTPELLAATGARYSRNNEGLEAIVSKIDFDNKDKSVDGIFKMIDYGHQSIADMTPIALFIDEISQFAAYYLWTLSPTAGGQECSTRYIKMDPSGLVDADTLGIPEHLRESFDTYNKRAFENYKLALELWTEIARTNPEATKIPQSLLDSDSEKDKKAVSRMQRNFAFDRARVYIPVAASTGVMMVQSARAWANVAATLRSHQLKELNLIGEQIADQLSIGAPRLVKHSVANQSIKDYLNFERQASIDNIDNNAKLLDNETLTFLAVENIDFPGNIMQKVCEFRTNRYSPFASVISRIAVKFAWHGISFGEIRDLNRHRTGNKYCPLTPIGFYGSTDQIPDSDNIDTMGKIYEIYKNFKSTTTYARDLMKENPEYIYFTSLGHKYYFEHTTTADKFLYEMELRTGVGAHFKYAEHCREALKLWYEKYPELKGVIFEGSAEPE
jgi:thymidylate synthase ThyX